MVCISFADLQSACTGSEGHEKAVVRFHRDVPQPTHVDCFHFASPTVSGNPIKHMSKSTRNTGKHWTSADVKQLKSLARHNTPTRVIGLKLGRTEDSIRSKANNEGVSLKPTNQAPYNR